MATIVGTDALCTTSQSYSGQDFSTSNGLVFCMVVTAMLFAYNAKVDAI